MLVLYFHFCGSISVIIITKLQLQSFWKKNNHVYVLFLRKKPHCHVCVCHCHHCDHCHHCCGHQSYVCVHIVVVIFNFILYFEKKGRESRIFKKNKDYNGSTKLGSCLATKRKFIVFTIVMVMFIVTIVVFFLCFVKKETNNRTHK